MRNLSLFDSFVRTTDPETSHEAAEAVEHTACRSEQLALNYIRRRPDGCICSDVVDNTSLEWNSASRRITSLIRKGKVWETGEKRSGPSGRRQRVVVVIDSSQEDKL